jgi:ribosomal protein L22
LQVRRILDVIRGRPYEEALMLAEYMPYRACETILKVLMSVSSGAGGCSKRLHGDWGGGLERGGSCCWHGSMRADGPNGSQLQAAANAKNNQGALKTKLVVSECYADGGPILKRFRPRAKGR